MTQVHALCSGCAISSGSGSDGEGKGTEGSEGMEGMEGGEQPHEWPCQLSRFRYLGITQRGGSLCIATDQAP